MTTEVVQASGFAAPGTGPSSTGVTTTDPSVIPQNPGGIGFVKGLRVIGGGNILIAKLSYQRELRVCDRKYRNKSGTMYISATAFCRAEVAQRYSRRALKAGGAGH